MYCSHNERMPLPSKTWTKLDSHLLCSVTLVCMVKGNAGQPASSTIMSSLLLWHIFKNSFNLGGYTGLNISIPRAASKNSASKRSRQLYYHYSQHMCQLFPGPLCLNGSNLWLAERKHITLSVCCLHTGPLLGYDSKAKPL